MTVRFVKWIRRQLLAAQCNRLSRQILRMRLDGRIRLLEMAREI